MITEQRLTERVVRQRLPLRERLLTRSSRQSAASRTTTLVREDDHMAHSLVEHGILERRPRLRFRRGGCAPGCLEDDRSITLRDEACAEVVVRAEDEHHS